MRFDVITLFPELFELHLVHGVTRRAFEQKLVDVRFWQLRDFGDSPHARVDDRPYGGGPGMVLLVEPLERVLAAVRKARAEAMPAPLVNFSPAGTPRSIRFVTITSIVCRLLVAGSSSLFAITW